MPELNWLGDQKARRAARHVQYRLLQPVAEIGEPDNENLLIQGDNLDALKSLLPLYAGRVKCVFIDPPYNTKSAFEHYDDNLEHSQWLSMIYPRLVLLRELLREDGSIWVTIDDNEAHYLKVVMDEVFGRGNFQGNVIWQHSVQGKNDSKKVSLHHNHVLCYRKSVSFDLKKVPRKEDHNVAYRNPDNDPKGAWRSGDVRSPNLRENLKYVVDTPSGRRIQPPAKGWRWSKEVFFEKVASGEILFMDNDTRVLRKIYLKEQEGRVAESIWFGEDVGTTRDASRELLALLPEAQVFATPKPEFLIKRIIEIATDPNDIVLDSFLGSGTTAAVAHKMGRRWIGIEMGEHATTHCLPRLNRVVEGENGGISEAVGWQGGGGFRFMRLGEPVFDADGRIREDVRFVPLAAYLWFLHTRTSWASAPAAASRDAPSPILGLHGETAVVLLYNGVLGDRRPQAGNVLTHAVLEDLRARLPEHVGPWLIYGEACRLGTASLKRFDIMFKQIPYDIRRG
jgi:adenine-specific DNA-methyltransferase